MAGLYFEDFEVGKTYRHPYGRTVTEMDNVLFTCLTMNTQTLHLDEEFARTTQHGARVVNSIFTLGLLVGMTVSDLTLGTTLGNLSMTDIRFPIPVFHGDTLRAETTILDKRASRSKLDRVRGGDLRPHRVQPARRGGRLLLPGGDDDAPAARGARMRLTDHASYSDAKAHFSRAALWELVDGSRERLNIAHECIDRHPPGRTAIRIAFADGRDEAYTFGEIAAWSSRFAHFLSRDGVRAGDRVAIFLEPSLPFYVALFGAMKAGAVAVPMFTLLGSDAVAARIEDCGPVLALAGAPLDGVRTVVSDDAFLAALQLEPDPFEPGTAASDMAMYQYTSGTTRALPEAVRHRHRAIVTVLIAALYATGVRPGDRFCCPSSPAWGHGLWHGTLGPLALGAEITAWSGRFDPVRMLAVLEEHRITNLSAAATHYRMMKNCGTAGEHRFGIEKLSFTGEPIDSDTAQFAERTFGSAVRSMYGTTEVGVILGGYPGAADLPMRPGSLGKSMPGVEVAIRQPSGAIAATAATGEIVVRRGDGWFPTRDLGRADEDGYFYHAGRADDVIISAGWTMSAVEIEDALLRHPDVSEIAVIGVPDELRGQVVKAFVVSERRSGDASFGADLESFARARLGQHEYPRRIEFVEELPKTPAGKVNRKALREREEVRPA